MEVHGNKNYLGGPTSEISNERKTCINSASLRPVDCLPHLLANIVMYQNSIFFKSVSHTLNTTANLGSP